MAQTTKEYIRGLKVRYTKQLIDLKLHKSMNSKFITLEQLNEINTKITLLENVVKDLDVV